MSTTTRLDVRPLGSTIGADVRGVDLAALGADDFAAIEAAWHENLVLRFRGQALTDAQLMAFSRRFGELDRVPMRAVGVLANDDPRVAVAPEAREYVNIISNVKVGGEPIGGLGNYANGGTCGVTPITSADQIVPRHRRRTPAPRRRSAFASRRAAFPGAGSSPRRPGSCSRAP